MKTNFSDIPDHPDQLDDYLAKRESAYPLKPGTAAKIIWNSESHPQKTEYSIVYLHGFRASHPEGDPAHRTIARKFGCNLFLSRLDEHGIESEYPLLDLTEEKLLQSARFALEIGKRIGKKVIIMGTSTGGSLALYLASREEFKPTITTLVLYSPLIRFHGIKEKFLMSSPGRKCLSVIPGRKHLIETSQTTYAEDRIWNKSYALGGAIALGSFVQHYMQKRLFARIKCPVFTGYYHKNSREQDTVVSVPAIRKMVKNLGSRTHSVKSVNFPEAKNHVICSSLVSKSVKSVIESTEKFLKNVVSQEAREK
ncbi:MAG TPA: hypothetical protein VJ964_10480 [Balneolaceae bacterium]|nr:hypothetical protein [Balneolaceae bacterium]